MILPPDRRRSTRCIKTSLIDLESGLLGLTDLLHDLFVTGTQFRIIMRLFLDDGANPVVLA